MDSITFSVAATASELATKVRAWLGGQPTTSLDAAPVTFRLETTAATSEKYAVVLVAVYTVGPRSLDVDDKSSPAGSIDEPLHRRAKLLAPPDRVSPAGACPRHVRGLLDRHVSALAAGMTMEEMLHKDSLSFMKEVLRRVNGDLLGNSGGLLVYGARVERLGVQVPCDKLSVAVVAPTTAFTGHQCHYHPVAKLTVHLAAAPGEALSVSVDAEGEPPATGKEEGLATKVPARVVVGVGAEFHTELRGKTTLRLTFRGKVTMNK